MTAQNEAPTHRSVKPQVSTSRIGRRPWARRVIVAHAAIVTLAIALLFAGPPASAATYSWTWSHSNGNHIVHSEYFDSRDAVTVDDQEKDGHSALVIVHNEARKSVSKCWDHDGATSTGAACGLPASFKENKSLWAELCIGEWASKAADQRTISCSGVRHHFVS